MTSLKDSLSEILKPAELAKLSRSYDIVGTIALIDVPDSLMHHAKIIGDAVLKTHKRLTTVLRKSAHEGEFRTHNLELLAGEDIRETLVNESGCSFLVDVEKVYFSVRLSTERERLARVITPGESVLVLFSGAAPYVIVLAKHSLAAKIVGVEKNPEGHKYGLENIRRNKVKNATLYCADAAKLSIIEERYDRIIMPAPANARDFIGSALGVAKPRVFMHVYLFAQEHELPLIFHEITNLCLNEGYKASQFHAVKTGRPAPYTFRYCIDFLAER